MELRERLILATMEEVMKKNLKFTMDDLAKKLTISKKTIYQEFNNKEDLISEAVDYYFRRIKDSERAVILDDSLDIVEKLKRVLIVFPDTYENIDFTEVMELKNKFPKVYEKVERHLDTEWEPTLNLYRMAVKEGRLRDINETVFKLMIQGSMKEFLSSRELAEKKIEYMDALSEMVDIVFRGLLV